MDRFLAILQGAALSPRGPIIVACAILAVLLVEILLQGKDNSFNVLRRSAVTRSADVFSMLLFLLNFTPVLVRLFSVYVLVAALNALGIPTLIGPGTTPLEVVARTVAALLVLDFLGYWAHRFDHEFFEWGWIAHRLHHSPTELNIASGWRFHPLNSLSWQVMMMLPHLMIFGAYPSTLFVYIIADLRRAWGHSRLNTNFGPLGVLIVSPLFHRRHHDIHDSKCNYGGLLTCWDHLFGTYRAPNENTINAPTGIEPGSTYESRGILHNLYADTVEFFMYFARLPRRAWRSVAAAIPWP